MADNEKTHEYIEVKPNEVSPNEASPNNTVDALEAPKDFKISPMPMADTKSYIIYSSLVSVEFMISTLSLIFYVALKASPVLIILSALGLASLGLGCLLSYQAVSRGNQRRQTFALVVFGIATMLCSATSIVALTMATGGSLPYTTGTNFSAKGPTEASSTGNSDPNYMYTNPYSYPDTSNPYSSYYSGNSNYGSNYYGYDPYGSNYNYYGSNPYSGYSGYNFNYGGYSYPYGSYPYGSYGSYGSYGGYPYGNYGGYGSYGGYPYGNYGGYPYGSYGGYPYGNYGGYPYGSYGGYPYGNYGGYPYGSYGGYPYGNYGGYPYGSYGGYPYGNYGGYPYGGYGGYPYGNYGGYPYGGYGGYPYGNYGGYPYGNYGGYPYGNYGGYPYGGYGGYPYGNYGGYPYGGYGGYPYNQGNCPYSYGYPSTFTISQSYHVTYTSGNIKYSYTYYYDSSSGPLGSQYSSSKWSHNQDCRTGQDDYTSASNSGSSTSYSNPYGSSYNYYNPYTGAIYSYASYNSPDPMSFEEGPGMILNGGNRFDDKMFTIVLFAFKSLVFIGLIVQGISLRKSLPGKKKTHSQQPQKIDMSGEVRRI